MAQASSRAYFGGKIVGVATDRLGTVRWAPGAASMVYRSYGTERTWTTSGWETWATYTQLGQGMDYADQRMYNSGMGKFFSPDPGGAAGADAAGPLSWNRYLYAMGDPVNRVDPGGTDSCLDEFGPMDGLVFDLPGCSDPALEGELIYLASIPNGNSLAAAASAAEVVIQGIETGISEVLASIFGILATAKTAGVSTLSGTRTWPPCVPPVGTIGYRMDIVPPSRPHSPHPGSHVHLYQMNQNPANGQCFWVSTGVTGPPPPPGAVPIGPATGGTN
jgi:RHS repeat-associated protein